MVLILPPLGSPWLPVGSTTPRMEVFSRRKRHAPDPSPPRAQPPFPPPVPQTHFRDTSPLQVLIRSNIPSNNRICFSGIFRLTNNCPAALDCPCPMSVRAE